MVFLKNKVQGCRVLNILQKYHLFYPYVHCDSGGIEQEIKEIYCRSPSIFYLALDNLVPTLQHFLRDCSLRSQ